MSAIVGLGLAVLYELAWWRMQSWVLSKRRGLAIPVAVGGFILRLLVVGLVFLALWAWTPLDILVVAVAFVLAFSVMSVFLLRRFTRPKPRTDMSISGKHSKE